MVMMAMMVIKRIMRMRMMRITLKRGARSI